MAVARFRSLFLGEKTVGEDETGLIEVVIVDDEELAIEKLKYLLRNFADVHVAETFTDPLEAEMRIEELAPSVVFLDIEMPGTNGLELADRVIRLNLEIAVIFVTAYSKYALEAFEIAAIDYLLKPVTLDRMEITLTRINKYRYLPQKVGVKESKNCYVQCLGRFDLKRREDITCSIKWRSAKVKELMAFFFYHRTREVPKERLIEEIFPDMEYERALINLNTCLYQLRKVLANPNAGIEIIYSKGYYCLRLGEVVIDVDLFEQAAKVAIITGRLEDLKKATLFYQGDYLEDEGYHWAKPRQIYLRELYWQVALIQGWYYLNTGSCEEARDYAWKLVERDNLEEKAWEFLIRTYIKLGDESLALRAYRKMEQIFAEELGLIPDSKIKELFNGT